MLILHMLTIKIDDVVTVLTFDRFSQARGYQYLMPRNTASHAFPFIPAVGRPLRVNGHRYERIA